MNKPYIKLYHVIIEIISYVVLIIAIILLKYKPTYKVTLAGQEIGYVENGAELENRIQQDIETIEKKIVSAVEKKYKNLQFLEKIYHLYKK